MTILIWGDSLKYCHESMVGESRGMNIVAGPISVLHATLELHIGSIKSAHLPQKGCNVTPAVTSIFPIALLMGAPAYTYHGLVRCIRPRSSTVLDSR